MSLYTYCRVDSYMSHCFPLLSLQSSWHSGPSSLHPTVLLRYTRGINCMLLLHQAAFRHRLKSLKSSHLQGSYTDILAPSQTLYALKPSSANSNPTVAPALLTAKRIS